MVLLLTSLLKLPECYQSLTSAWRERAGEPGPPAPPPQLVTSYQSMLPSLAPFLLYYPLRPLQHPLIYRSFRVPAQVRRDHLSHG